MTKQLFFKLIKKLFRVSALISLIFIATFPFSFGITNDVAFLNFSSALSLTVVPIIYGLATISYTGFFASFCTSTLIGYILLLITWSFANFMFFKQYFFVQEGFNLYNLGLLLPALPNLYHTFQRRVHQELIWVNLLIQVALCLFIIALIVGDIKALGDPLHGYSHSENVQCLLMGIFVSGLIWLLVRKVFVKNIHMYGQLASYVKVMAKPTVGFFTGYLSIMLLFAGLYSLSYYFNPEVFNKLDDSTFGSMLYYSFSIITGLGFSVIEPEKPITFFLTALENFLGLVWVTVVFAAALAYFQAPFKKLAITLKKEEEQELNRV